MCAQTVVPEAAADEGGVPKLEEAGEWDLQNIERAQDAQARSHHIYHPRTLQSAKGMLLASAHAFALTCLNAINF